MPASRSGQIVTLSGTGNDPSVFKGIPGISHFGGPNGDVYIFDGLKLVCEQTSSLNIDPKSQRLVFLESCPDRCFLSNGTLTVGSQLTVGSDLILSSGEWLTIYKKGSNPFSPTVAGFVMGPNSTHNFNGGSVRSRSSIVFAGNVNTAYGSGSIPGIDIILFDGAQRLLPLGGSLSNVTVRGNGFKILGTLSESPRNLKILHAAGGLGVMVDGRNGAQNFLLLENYSFIGRGDLTVVNTGDAIKSNNTEKGTDVTVSHNTNFGTSHHVEFTTDIDFEVKDTNGLPVEGALVKVPLKDNGNRENIPGINARDFTADTDAEILTNNLGQASTNICIGASTYNNSTQKRDYRSLSGTSADDFEAFLISFLHQPAKINFFAKGKSSLNFVGIPDLNVTGTKAQADSLSEISTSQEAYNKSKAFWVDSKGQHPIALSLEGNTIKSTHDIIFDANVSSVFDFDESTITIKATVFTGNIETTGTVTFLNGATQNGGLIDVNGDSFVSFENIQNWTIYPTKNDRDNNTNPLESGTTNNYRFNFSSATTFFGRVTKDSVVFLVEIQITEPGETVFALTAEAILSTLPSAKQVADAVWDKPVADHNTAGTTGEALQNSSVDLSTLETKVEADARQAILVQEHNDTQVAVGNIPGPITKQDVRDAMKLAPSAGAPDLNSIDDRQKTINEGVQNASRVVPHTKEI